MLAAAIIVAGIALVDSLNPATIGPALVLAASRHPVRRILEFAAAYFVVNVAAGIVLLLGISLLPNPSDQLKHGAGVVAGVALIAAAVALLVARERLRRPRPPKESRGRAARSAPLFGAGIALAELPTAFAYFAAVAAIRAADLSPVQEVALIVGFNLLFLLPVFLIAVVLEFFPSAWERFINPFRRWISRHWPHVLAAALAAGGVALLVYGL